MQQACNDSHNLTPLATNLTERSLIISCWRFTGISRISFVKVQLFSVQYSSYLFPEVFSCQISWNSNEWFSRNRCISKYKFSFNHNFLTYYTCAAFNWVLSATKKKLRIAGFFVSLPFLTHLCNKGLKPSVHSFPTRRSSDLHLTGFFR